MLSKFSIKGHPLHPLLVALPIGLFFWTLVADFAYLGTDKDKMWYDMALWTGLAAFVSALVAALPGFGDYLTIARKSDARTIATAHMLLNLAVVALFVVAWALMLDDGALTGSRLGAVVILHVAGVGLLALSGWLGGEMVFRHHLAMVPDSGELARDEEMRHARTGSGAPAGRTFR